MSVNLPNCPDDCTAELPSVQFSECAPETNNGEIRKIYIANVGNPLADWTDPTEWATRLAQTTEPTAIRSLTILADKPRAESQEKKISGNRTIKGNKAHTINIDIDETNTVNYEMLRTFECGKQYLLWYQDERYMYGGTDGIAASINLDHLIDRDRNNLQLFQGEAKWESQFSPERIASPIA